MSALSDRDILRAGPEAGVGWVGSGGSREPWRIQPASVEVTLCGEEGTLLGYPYLHPDVLASGIWDIDPESPPKMAERDWDLSRGRKHYTLAPGEFLLACTQEVVQCGSAILAILDGKSSLGRLGLSIHSTAGYIDPGWIGRITLELTNHAPRPIRLWAGMRIGQIRFERLSSPAERPYGAEGLGSHYQRSLTTVQSASVAPSGPESPASCPDSSLLAWGAAGAPVE